MSGEAKRRVAATAPPYYAGSGVADVLMPVLTLERP
jgi:hypothetical protein